MRYRWQVFLMTFYSVGIAFRNALASAVPQIFKNWLQVEFPSWKFAIFLVFKNKYIVDYVTAQAFQEGVQKSKLAVDYNNIFGITYAASKYNNGSVIVNDNHTNIPQQFAVYKTKWHCVLDYYYYINHHESNSIKGRNKWLKLFLYNTPKINYEANTEVTENYLKGVAYGYHYYGHYYTGNPDTYANNIVSVSRTYPIMSKSYIFCIVTSIMFWLIVGSFTIWFIRRISKKSSRDMAKKKIKQTAKRTYKSIRKRF